MIPGLDPALRREPAPAIGAPTPALQGEDDTVVDPRAHGPD
jgi:alpha-beta hydrolase superfamily lysophospholipase